MIISDSELLDSISEIEFIVHFDEGELPRFWFKGEAWVLGSLDRLPDHYKGVDMVMVPMMDVDLGDDPVSVIREMMRPLVDHGKVTLVIRGDEIGFLTAPKLEVYIPQSPSCWAEAMSGGPH